MLYTPRIIFAVALSIALTLAAPIPIVSVSNKIEERGRGQSFSEQTPPSQLADVAGPISLYQMPTSSGSSTVEYPKSPDSSQSMLPECFHDSASSHSESDMSYHSLMTSVKDLAKLSRTRFLASPPGGWPRWEITTQCRPLVYLDSNSRSGFATGGSADSTLQDLGSPPAAWSPTNSQEPSTHLPSAKSQVEKKKPSRGQVGKKTPRRSQEGNGRRQGKD